jgi:hypothetical protein
VRPVRLVRLLIFALMVLIATALLGRYVVHGTVDRESLAVAVARESGSADDLLGGSEPCRTTDRVGVWRCRVGDSEGSGTAVYRVSIRPGSSCWDARRIRDDSEAGMPRRAGGCVYRWQWSLFRS